MKNKNAKLAVLVLLGLLSLYFVVSKNGSFSYDITGPGMLTLGYAVAVSIFWGIYKLVMKKGGRATLAALVFFASIMGMSFLTKYPMSPTQYLAVIALFYYSSKILENVLKK